jgi:L-aminopeptidase/D-esterase-like protein
MATTAHDGLARAIRPAHSPLDGDTLFALATGTAPLSTGFPMPPAFPQDLRVLDEVCTAAAVCVERAIVDAILAARTVAGIPAYADLFAAAGNSRIS